MPITALDGAASGQPVFVESCGISAFPGALQRRDFSSVIKKRRKKMRKHKRRKRRKDMQR